MQAMDISNRIRTVFNDKRQTAKWASEWTWGRKPDTWVSALPTVSAPELREADPVAFDAVPVFTLAQLYGDDDVYSSTPWSDQKADFREQHHLAKGDAYNRYTSDPDQVTIYVIDARKVGGGYILVNSEGYEYIRYAVRLEDFDPAMRGKVTAHPVEFQIPGDILLDIARVLHRGSIGTTIGGERASQIFHWLQDNAPQIITEERLLED